MALIRISGGLKDPRVIAAGIAVGCMLVDDLPEHGYNTFHDPGAAAMLSIILADAFTLWWRRGWKPLVFVTFWFALLLKLFIQPVFWIHNAAFWDTATLLATHSVLSLLAIRGANVWVALTSLIVSTAAIAAAWYSCVSLYSGDSWIAEYWLLGFARILAPSAFWTAVLLVEKYCLESESGRHSPTSS